MKTEELKSQVVTKFQPKSKTGHPYESLINQIVDIFDKLIKTHQIKKIIHPPPWGEVEEGSKMEKGNCMVSNSL